MTALKAITRYLRLVQQTHRITDKQSKFYRYYFGFYYFFYELSYILNIYLCGDTGQL